MPGRAWQKAWRIARHPGHTLYFLPGGRDQQARDSSVGRRARAASSRAPRRGGAGGATFRRSAGVLATNVAETSVTVEA
jgi:hypothetical protein